jgi:hypothetical protein
MAGTAEAVEGREAKRPPSRRFFQRSIVRQVSRRIKVADLKGLPEGLVDALRAAHLLAVDYVVLSCSHQMHYRRLRPFPTKRTVAPCYACGSAPRVYAERLRDATKLRKQLNAIAGACPLVSKAALEEQASRFDSLTSFVATALKVRCLDPNMDPMDYNARAEGLYGDLDLHARKAGLLDGPEDGDLGEHGGKV